MLAGECSHDLKCQHASTVLSTLCEEHLLLAGHCPHGVKCQHAHSAEELRVSVLIQSDVLDEEYHIEFCQSLIRGGTCAIGAALSLLACSSAVCK